MSPDSHPEMSPPRPNSSGGAHAAAESKVSAVFRDIVVGLGGVRRALVADWEGRLIAEFGSHQDPDGIAAIVGSLGIELDSLGQILGCGFCQVAIVKCPQATRILAIQKTIVASLELEASRPVADLENRLREIDWAQALQKDVVDLTDQVEIELEASDHPKAPQPLEAGGATTSPTPRPARGGDLGGLVAMSTGALSGLRAGQRASTDRENGGSAAAVSSAAGGVVASGGGVVLVGATGAGASAGATGAQGTPKAAAKGSPGPMPKARPVAPGGEGPSRGTASAKGISPLTPARAEAAAAPALGRSALRPAPSGADAAARGGKVAAHAADESRGVDAGWEAPTDTAPSGAVDQAALRRALMRGDLPRAESIGARLFGETAEVTQADAERDREALSSLVHGIAAVLSGDNFGGLAYLNPINDGPEAVDASVRWAARIWTARANVNADDQLDAARVGADAALLIATALDTEAQAVSLAALAEIALVRGEDDAALSYVAAARELLTSPSDDHEIASSWLLEARVLAHMKRDAESRIATERAHRYRPSWPAPLLLMANRALQSGNLQEAEDHLRGVLDKGPASDDAERFRRLLSMLQKKRLTVAQASEYLRLLDAQPSEAAITDLRRLASACGLSQVREALGWKLLRVGQYAEASAVFNKLSEDPDLAPHERSSVLLALGCLAAVESRHEKTGVKLRAAVRAVPERMASAPPAGGPVPPVVPPSSSCLAPAELRPTDQHDSTKMRVAFPVDEPKTSPRAVPTGPVFAGNLRLFCLPDLLEFLRSGQRTGTLVCASEAGIGAVHLRSGRITGAASPNAKGVGEWLVERGALSREQLERAVQAQNDSWSRRLIGSVLLEKRLVKAELLRDALKEQIYATIRELMGWVNGQFAFDPEAVVEATSVEIEVELDPQVVLLNIYKDLDESGADGR